MKHLLTLILLLLAVTVTAVAQDYNDGFNQTDANSYANSGLDRHPKDSTKTKKKIPRRLRVWTVDMFGDRTKTTPDTLPHLFQNSVFTNGVYGEYNNLGNAGSPRVHRIFTDRYTGNQFFFLDPYDFFVHRPEEFHFTNTLSPITNISYNTCGSGNFGEDHINAKFATNAGKKLGVGFILDYLYAKGYYQNSATSHFGGSLFGSYIDDRYEAHLLGNFNHQKVTENGGITNDEYVLHPSIFSQSYDDSEIPTVLDQNWNRNDNNHVFLNHRYSFGFRRKVKMTEEEIEARKFALASKKANDTIPEKDKTTPEEPVDTTWMKDEYVPVTSIVHTFNFDQYERIYQAYSAPEGFYKNTYFHSQNDKNIYDQTKHISVRNDVALAMLEGFNKWVPMGLKLFISHQYRRYDLTVDTLGRDIVNEHHFSLGGQLQKTLGRLFHYKVKLETYVIGHNAGDILLDGSGDVNFPLFGDTVSVLAKAHFHRTKPTFFYNRYQSKHFWWNNDLASQTNTHVEGTLNIGKTNTKLRFAFDNYDHLAYFAYKYDITKDYGRRNADIEVAQSGNESLITLQLMQSYAIGPLNIEAKVTYQKSTNQNVMPVPALDIYGNIFLKFRIAKVLDTELGADIRYFTRYNAPDYCPAIGQFCVQGNEEKVQTGGYPFINVYANFHLKHCRFFVMMSQVNASAGNYFLTPHYPQNTMTLRLGLSWNFFN